MSARKRPNLDPDLGPEAEAFLGAGAPRSREPEVVAAGVVPPQPEPDEDLEHDVDDPLAELRQAREQTGRSRPQGERAITVRLPVDLVEALDELADARNEARLRGHGEDPRKQAIVADALRAFVAAESKRLAGVLRGR